MPHGCSDCGLNVSHFDVHVSATELENRPLPLLLHIDDADLAERCIPEEPAASRQMVEGRGSTLKERGAGTESIWPVSEQNFRHYSVCSKVHVQG